LPWERDGKWEVMELTTSTEKDLEMDPPTAILGISINLFLLFYLGCLFCVLFYKMGCNFFSSQNPFPPLFPPSIFIFLTFLFIVDRILWCVFSLFTLLFISFVLDRLAYLLSAVSSLVLLCYWVNRSHLMSTGQHNYTIWSQNFFLTKYFAWGFWVSAVIPCGVEVIFIVVVFSTSNMEFTSGITFTCEIVVSAVVYLLICIVYLVYALILVWKIKTKKNRLKRLLKIFLLFGTLISCLVVKFVFLLYRPITSHYLNKLLFYSCAYFFPELVFFMILLWVVFTARIRQQTLEDDSWKVVYAESSHSFYRSTTLDGEEYPTPEETILSVAIAGAD